MPSWKCRRDEFLNIVEHVFVIVYYTESLLYYCTTVLLYHYITITPRVYKGKPIFSKMPAHISLSPEPQSLTKKP